MAIPEFYLQLIRKLDLKAITLPNKKKIWEANQEQCEALISQFGPIRDQISFPLAPATALIFDTEHPVLILSEFNSGLVIPSQSDLQYFLSKLRFHGFSSVSFCWYLSLQREETLSLMEINEYQLLPSNTQEQDAYELIPSREILLCSPSRRAMWFKNLIDFQLYSDWASRFDLYL